MKNKVWITPCGHGGYNVNVGNRRPYSVPVGYLPGMFVPGAFIIESCHCDTLREAKRIQREKAQRDKAEIINFEG